LPWFIITLLRFVYSNFPNIPDTSPLNASLANVHNTPIFSLSLKSLDFRDAKVGTIHSPFASLFIHEKPPQVHSLRKASTPCLHPCHFRLLAFLPLLDLLYWRSRFDPACVAPSCLWKYVTCCGQPHVCGRSSLIQWALGPPPSVDASTLNTYRSPLSHDTLRSVILDLSCLCCTVIDRWLLIPLAS
jgi:hypothetical protein